MAVQLPNGVLLALGTTIGSDVTVTALSNANPGVATAAAHGLSDGDIVVVTSGWSRLNNRVVRVDSSTTGTFALEGINTSDTNLYPAGTGTGSVNEVSAWTQLSQVISIETSGGEMQFTTYSFLENDFETQLPTQSSPQPLTLTLADDPSLSGYTALVAAAQTRDNTPLRMTMPNGSVLLYNGVVSVNETPVMTKNEIITVTATFSLQALPVRYAS